MLNFLSRLRRRCAFWDGFCISLDSVSLDCNGYIYKRMLRIFFFYVVVFYCYVWRWRDVLVVCRCSLRMDIFCIGFYYCCGWFRVFVTCFGESFWNCIVYRYRVSWVFYVVLCGDENGFRVWIWRNSFDKRI